MNKILTFCLFCFILPFLLFSEQPYVLVSVAPHKFFVEKIAKDTLNIILMVPPAASIHTYEPTPKQMLNASSASLWFRIGEPFEERAIRALKDHNPQLQIVDLREGLDLIGASCKCCKAAMDLHFWLSARMAQTQAKTICSALIKSFPQHAQVYQSNLDKFLRELQELDGQITKMLSAIPNRNIFVSHPAYAYFCRDYQLKQYSIEFEGKDPSPQQLLNIMNRAKELKIKTIFIQQQYSSKGARLIADEIGARVKTLDPYSEHYFDSMLGIAHAFAEG